MYYMKLITETVILVFIIFYSQGFENAEHRAMYCHIFTDNIIICHKNIYQVLEHVCVATSKL